MADKTAFCVAALMVCALSACGQKGPLYLPEAPSEVVTRPAATPPSPAPEVPVPEEDDPKKDKSAAPPPPK